jgi:hypothetical protein
VSPTLWREQGFRFFFFSREETRVHVHVYNERGEAKFWLQPRLELAMNSGLPKRDLRLAEKIIEEHYDEFVLAWRRYFPAGSN